MEEVLLAGMKAPAWLLRTCFVTVWWDCCAAVTLWGCCPAISLLCSSPIGCCPATSLLCSSHRLLSSNFTAVQQSFVLWGCCPATSLLCSSNVNSITRPTKTLYHRIFFEANLTDCCPAVPQAAGGWTATVEGVHECCNLRILVLAPLPGHDVAVQQPDFFVGKRWKHCSACVSYAQKMLPSINPKRSRLSTWCPTH